MTAVEPARTPAVERDAAAPDFVPIEWSAGLERDVALDLLRGLAMVVLVVNHLRLDSPLSAVTSAVFSAAEVLVAVSGVVVGMVFGRRWLSHGRRATTRMLLRRAGKLYVASVVVVALVAVLRFVPGLETDALTVSAGTGRDLYESTGVGDLALAVVTLDAGPWQFSILGFFITILAVAPLALHALERGWWLALAGLSWFAYGVGRATSIDVLPAQSEDVFSVLTWQLLFVHGMIAGWHRRTVSEFVRRRQRNLRWIAIVAAGVVVSAWLGGALLTSRPAWLAWQHAHFEKSTLDPARVFALTVVGLAAYLALARRPPVLDRWLRAILLPLGKNSFYVFIMHVFVCLTVASALAALPMHGQAVSLVVELGAVAALVAMVRRRFLFTWVPR